MELLEDNIVNVARQMIDKEASVPSASLGGPGASAVHGVLAERVNGGGQVMELDDEEI